MSQPPPDLPPPPSALGRRTISVRNVAASYAGSVVEAVVFLLLTPFMIRELGLAAYGLWGVAVAMGETLAADDLLGHLPLVARFHQIIVEAADNEFIGQFLDMLRAPLVRHQFRIILVPGRKEESLAEHRQILSYIEGGDAAGADPFLGEGISIALAYGALAARQIGEAFAQQDFSFGAYRRRVLASSLGQALMARWLLAYLIYSFKWKSFQVLIWRILRPLGLLVAQLFVLNWGKRFKETR